MVLPHHPLTELSRLNETELAECEEAYAAVESYFLALRVRNRLLISELVRKVLGNAFHRKKTEPERPLRVLAVEEALAEIASWTQKVLDEPLEYNRLAVRGRLALLLAGMPDKWQSVFLTAAPWPPEFVTAMRSAYLVSAPGFAGLPMEARPLDLNVFGTSAAQWWDTLDRRPIVRAMFWGLVLALLGFATWFIYFG